VTGESVRPSEKFLNKKSRFYAGAVWLEALLEFEDELHEHLEAAGEDPRRFQDGRLFRSLTKHIKARANGREEWVLLLACYQFVTNTSRHLGYEEARRLHGEEMEARGLVSAREFCCGMPKGFALAPEAGLSELLSRVRSVASWMEAQESFSFWLVYKNVRAAWQGVGDERARAVAAIYLSRPGIGKWPRCGRRTWTQRQWRSILRHAALLSEKKFRCTELERWVWWCYPVFWRYRWNVRQVLESASRRGIDFGKTRIDEIELFQKRWIRRGLRFRGGKQEQDLVLPLAGFVERVVLPDADRMWGSTGGILFLPKNSS
jgi:hypothetical protein